jgi:hypothetical protein
LNTHNSVTILNRTHIYITFLSKMSWFITSFSLCTSTLYFFQFYNLWKTYALK